MDSTQVLLISTLVGNVIGLVLKRWPAFKNQLIPICLFGMAIVKNILASAGLLPESVTSLGLDNASIGVVSAFVDTTFSVGLHSFAKNTSNLWGRKKKR